MENEISARIINDNMNAGTWKERFGLELVRAAVESIEISESSRESIKKYAAKKIELSVYDDVSKKASDIAAQQKIAEGIKEHGFGNMGGMIFGMNIAQGLNNNAGTNTSNINQQLEILQQLKGALDAGILTQEEFDAKKKEIIGL